MEKYLECKEVIGSNGRLSTGVAYRIRPSHSKRYLDGMGKDSKYIEKHEDNINNQTWFIESYGNHYRLKPKHSSRYLSGMGKNSKYIEKCKFDADECLWDFFTDGDYFKLQPKHSGRWLDGMGEDSKYIEKHTSDSSVQKWCFIPLNFKLTSYISDFNFGDQSAIDQLLNQNKQVAFSSTENIIAKVIGGSCGNEYGEEVSESFSFSLDQSITRGIEAEVSCKIPGAGGVGVGVKTSLNVTFGANETWESTKTKNFKSEIKFTAPEVGVFKIGKIVYVANNVELPFTAKLKMSATKESDKNYKYGSKAIEAYLKAKGKLDDVKVINWGKDYLEAEIKGKMKASFAVDSHNIFEKVGDIKKFK